MGAAGLLMQLIALPARGAVFGSGRSGGFGGSFASGHGVMLQVAGEGVGDAGRRRVNRLWSNARTAFTRRSRYATAICDHGRVHPRTTCPMSLLLLAVGVLLTALLFRLRRPRAARCVGVVWFVLFWLLGNGLLAGRIVDATQAGQRAPARVVWQPGAVIIVLGMGMQRLPHEGGIEPQSLAYSRILRAVQLFDACKAATQGCKVLVSGGDPAGLGNSEAELYASLIEEAGVPAADVWKEEASRNTWENAKFTARLLSSRPHGPLVLVTSGLHMRRSLLYFRHFGLQPTPERSDYTTPFASWLPNSYNLLISDLAAVEWLGIARYHWYNWLGRNDPPIEPAPEGSSAHPLLRDRPVTLPPAQ
ncbi:YdcF family protein [Pseudoxanthomonas sp. X-1]|nr:YdcF family protein [Pseudoxanthomonas sp. X-1]